MQIIFVRHGQDVDNAAGVLNGHRNGGLTELGRRQVLVTAREFAGRGVDVILSSPLARAKESADILAAELGVAEVVVWPDLIERDFGEFSGVLKADLPRDSGDFVQVGGVTYFLAGKNVESFSDLLVRAKRVLARILDEYSGKTVLLVSHGDFGKMFLAAVKGLSWRQGLESDFISNAGWVEFELS